MLLHWVYKPRPCWDPLAVARLDPIRFSDAGLLLKAENYAVFLLAMRRQGDSAGRRRMNDLLLLDGRTNVGPRLLQLVEKLALLQEGGCSVGVREQLIQRHIPSARRFHLRATQSPDANLRFAWLRSTGCGVRLGARPCGPQVKTSCARCHLRGAAFPSSHEGGPPFPSWPATYESVSVRPPSPSLAADVR